MAFVEQLTEDWVSEPSTSQPGSVNSSFTGSLYSPNSSIRGTTRILSERPESTINSTSTKPSRSRTSSTSEGPDWKRMGMDGRGDLFSPIGLENLFRPPPGAPDDAPLSPSPQPQERVGSRKGPRSKGKGRSYLPKPNLALDAVPEESPSRSPPKLSRHISAPAMDDPQKPVMRNLTRHGLGLGLRRFNSEPFGFDGAGDDRVEKRVEKKDAKKDVGRFADIDELRSPLLSPALSDTGSIASRSSGGSLRRRSSRFVRNVSTTTTERNERLTPVTLSKLGEKLYASPAGPPRALDSSDDEVDARRYSDSPQKKLYSPASQDGSVWPSSPPFGFGQLSLSPGNVSATRSEAEWDGEPAVLPRLRPSPPSPSTPFKSPQKQRPLPDPCTPVRNRSSPSLGNSLLYNIRRHKSAEKSPVPPLARRTLSQDSDDDIPFYTPHPYKYGSPTDDVTAPKMDEPKKTGSPLKIFHSSYDTFTNAMLARRLGELEGDESDDDGDADVKPQVDVPPERDEDQDNTHSSQGSVIVSRLEDIARQQEIQQAPTPSQGQSPVQKPGNGERKEERFATNKVPRRRSSAPSCSPARKATRRMRSDSFDSASEEGPSSPIKDRTPKRLRRSLSGGYSRVGGDSRRASSDRLLQNRRTSGSVDAGRPRRRVQSVLTPEPGSILASSSRTHSRTNSGESVPPAEDQESEREGTPSPPSRGRKKAVIRYEDNRPVPSRMATDSPKLTFSGNQGDAMPESSFDLPATVGEVSQFKSVRTDSFLRQAQEVMERIRKRGARNTSTGSSMQSTIATRTTAEKVSDEGSSEVGEIAAAHEIPDFDYSHYDEEDGSVRRRPVLRLTDNEPLFGESMRSQSTNGSGSAYSSVHVIENSPAIFRKCLTGAAKMTFDEKNLRWIRAQASMISPGGRSMQSEFEDPFLNISDLSVDSSEETRALDLMRMRGNWDGEGSLTLWRSSKTKPLPDMEEQEVARLVPLPDESVDGKVAGKCEESEDSQRSRSSSESSICKKDGAEHVEVADRKASEGSIVAPTRAEKVMLIVDDDEIGNSSASSNGGSRQSSGCVQESDATSPKTPESSHTMDFDSVEKARLFSQIAPRCQKKRAMSPYIARPVSRISEEEESTQDHMSKMLPDFASSLGKLSITTPAKHKTPERKAVSVPPSASRANVSFHLSPLPDMSYRFEATEMLLNLELTYMSTRRGPESTKKAVEDSFYVAQEKLVKALTDVESFEPYWDHIKSLKLNDMNLETLHELQDWCPRVEELEVNRNELGQLSGVPEGVMRLEAQNNYLGDDTYFAHLVHLENIDVSGNDLSKLDAIKSCRHLRELKVDCNQLTSLDGVFGMSNLTVIRARRNDLESVDFTNCNLPKLVELDLRGNRLTSIKGLDHLPSLVHLNLDENAFTSFTSPPLPSLRSLKLTLNNLQTLDLTPFPNLRILYADNNALRSIPGLSKLRNLDAISVREQRGEGARCELPTARLFEARKVYLSSNPLRQLQWPAEFLNLQYLELASCSLRTLPRNFGETIRNARVLNLNFNDLESLDEIRGIRRLKVLLAAGNKLRRTGDVTRGINGMRISHLDVRNNPVSREIYPVENCRVVERELKGEEYVKEPWTVGKACSRRDRQWVEKMEMGAKVARRSFWARVGRALGMEKSGKGRLKELDGLTYDAGAIWREDDVMKMCVESGILEEERDDVKRGESREWMKRSDSQSMTAVGDESVVGGSEC